ncbi:MAG TPA: PilZ domain-containing protein [Gemmataceae bacterium]|nr:PilZ domain-containing protein [Gemmataceae bacterium]
MPGPETVCGHQAGEPLWKAPPERRSVTRYQMGSLRRCQLLCGESPVLVDAWLADLSACGVGLVFADPVEPQSVVAVHLAPGPFLASRAVAARVVYCVPLDEGLYLAGAEFARRLTAEELRILLS